MLVSRCRKLLDTDLFMGFLIDYFFGDFQLAALLFRMEDALHEDGSLETYIMELVENVNDLVDQYERYAMKLAPGHVSTARDNNAYARYHNFSEDVALRIEMSLAYSSIRSMHIMWPSFAAGRHILRLFVAPADVEIDEAGTFKAHCRGAEGLIEGATLEVARPISKEKVAGVGSIEALLLPRTFRVVICVFLGHELIATIDALSGNINDAEAATACDRLSSYLALEAASVDQVHSKLRARAKAKAYEFFSNLALGTDNGVPQDENILREMDEGGVVQLLAEYPGQAEWLARLSLSGGGKLQPSPKLRPNGVCPLTKSRSGSSQ